MVNQNPTSNTCLLQLQSLLPFLLCSQVLMLMALLRHLSALSAFFDTIKYETKKRIINQWFMRIPRNARKALLL